MHYRYLTILLVLLLSVTAAFSQNTTGVRGNYGDGNQPKLVITGRVLDATFETPVNYANVILFNKQDSSKVTGDATDKNGYFELIGFPPGQYLIKVSFIGFEEKTIDNVRIGPSKPTLDLGDISLEHKIFTLQEAGVTFTKPEIEYKIDKKVINVDKQYTAASGTAVDVLETTPSVSVDIEGNVSLRGSSNFSVLVNGQPSMLDPNDILQQISSGTIQNIEIITNPSAKYDPEGSSGIINIILKKNKLQGISGIVNSNTGIYDTYGGDAQIGYKDSKLSYNIGVDYNNKNNPGTLTNKLQTYSIDTTLFVNSEGDNSRNRLRAGVNGSFGYNITEIDHINLGLRFGQGNMDSESDLDFTEWTEPGSGETKYSSLGDSKREMDYTSVTLTYKHYFDQEYHNLSILTNYGQRKIEGESASELFDNNNQAVEGKKNTENRTSNRYRLQIDYTKPLREGHKFEAGYQNTYGKPEDKTELFELNTATGQYELQSLFSHQTDYVRDIRSLYLMYSGEYSKLGFQGGLRGEYTYRHIESVSANQETSIKHWDYFPSLHLSYSIDDANQVATSYTRRIQRPRRWNLEPFETWVNAYNVRRGNPSLKPEYIDSYELSYQKKCDRNSLSAEVYYRKNNDRIEQISSVYSEGITLNTYENAGIDHSIGAE
ncbi:TonB-dependent receptor, partial [bacterium]|nr:TonB-dependent receptor [bacterium]